MTRKDIANQINHIGNLVRTISTHKRLFYTVGDIYNNRGKVESWQDSSAIRKFKPETDGKFIYTFYCENVPCHKVDYENINECNVLNSLNCDNECEVLVLETAKMVVTSFSIDNDCKENESHSVQLKFIGFE